MVQVQEPPALRGRWANVSRLLHESTYRARALRRSQTPDERELWALLRGRRLDGAKFRRQHPIGPFIVDFFCEEAALAVEADGEPHFRHPPRDGARDAWLEAVGILVLRFENDETLQRPHAVLDRIRAELQRPT